MKNKKGFMLAEIVIVSVVIMVALVSLFTLTNKMFIQYDKRIVYDNVDATYVARGLAENFTYGLVKNDFANNSEKNYLEYDTKVSGDLKSSFDSFIKNNNVIESYIVRYKKESIENLLTSESNSNNIEQNFYDYIELYKDSNDFSDSSFVNTQETAKTYNFIIFTAISDNCDDEGICTEDNGNISFGNYKFKYIITEKEDYVVNYDEPPKVSNIFFEGKSNSLGIYDTDGYITWKAVDYYGSGIESFNISVTGIYSSIGIEVKKEVKCEKENDEYNCKLDGQELFYDKENQKFKLKLEHLGIPKNDYGYSGAYNITIYGTDFEGYSGEGSCNAVSSDYCSKKNIVVGKLDYSFSSDYNKNGLKTCPKVNWPAGFDVSIGIYQGATIKFNNNHDCMATNPFRDKLVTSWEVKDKNDNFLKKTDGSDAKGTGTGEKSVKLGNNNFKIFVSVNQVSKK